VGPCFHCGKPTEYEKVFPISRHVRKHALLAVLLISLVAVLWLALFPPETPFLSPTPPGPEAFVQADGRILVQNGSPIRLESVSFSNYYSFDLGEHGFDLHTSLHHSERDFERVREMGFNTVRFAFNGNWYMTDPVAFWRWLDQNIDWAKEAGVMLSLDLHVPIGGYWLAPNGDNTDFSIWTNEDTRQNNLDLWREIAKRYKDEPVIAAYELLNEAVTDDASGDQWRELANDLVATVRQVDSNHLLIVGALYGTNRQYTEMNQGSQFLVNDSNVMYDFHFYQPIEFTHQNASWLERPISDGGQYPDYETPIPTGRQVLIPDSSISVSSPQAGDSAWTEYESEWVVLDAQDAVAGLPIMVLRSGASGSAEFDDVKVFEFDTDSGQITEIATAPLSQEGIQQWWPWGNVDPENTPFSQTRSETSGANDPYSLQIEGVTGAQEYLGWSSDSLWFKATPGNLYQVTGQIKGTGIIYPDHPEASSAYIGIELNFYADPIAPDTNGFLFRDRAYLEAEFSKMYQFGIENEVPMSVMEFGTIRDTFETQGKGGAIWITDILEIFHENDISFSLWNYHGSSMGIFLSDYGTEPSIPNLKLIEILEHALAEDDS